MSNGIKALRQIQMSRETTQGSPTASFTVWRGTGALEDTRETVFPEEDIGIFGGVDRQYFAWLGSRLELEETEATFEQLPHILDAGIALAAPTTDASSAFIRTYTFPIAADSTKSSSDLQTYSFKCGDNNEVEKFSFGFVTEFNLSGVAKESLKMSATFEGRETTTDSGFAAVSIPAVEEILFGKGRLYIDEVSTDFGTTEISQTLLGMELNITTGWQAVFSADGRSDFSFIKQVRPEITLDVTFEHNGNASAEKTKRRSGTARLIQLKFTGAGLTTTDASAPYDTKTLLIRLAGKWDTFEKLDEQDGNDVIKATFRARYNATANAFAQLIVVNELASIPG